MIKFDNELIINKNDMISLADFDTITGEDVQNHLFDYDIYNKRFNKLKEFDEFFIINFVGMGVDATIEEPDEYDINSYELVGKIYKDKKYSNIKELALLYNLKNSDFWEIPVYIEEIL